MVTVELPELNRLGMVQLPQFLGLGLNKRTFQLIPALHRDAVPPSFVRAWDHFILPDDRCPC